MHRRDYLNCHHHHKQLDFTTLLIIRIIPLHSPNAKANLNSCFLYSLGFLHHDTLHSSYVCFPISLRLLFKEVLTLSLMKSLFVANSLLHRDLILNYLLFTYNLGCVEIISQLSLVSIFNQLFLLPLPFQK